MDTVTIDVKEAEMQLSKLLALALQGNKVIITENQEPVVQLEPIRKQNQLVGDALGWVDAPVWGTDSGVGRPAAGRGVP
jgi:antitoxin (DNA-binding transcriptional repressor) of toxin-antitoxin stability system